MKKIYLAGFTVFLQDAVEQGTALKSLCREFGFQGVFPLDNAAPPALSGAALAKWIYASNIQAIINADIVMANLNNFRGNEPDSGTAFEVGYAAALGKPVWAYLDPTGDLLQQVAHRIGPHGQAFDQDGYIVEDFGLPRNLMLACSAKIVPGDARACLAQNSIAG